MLSRHETGSRRLAGLVLLLVAVLYSGTLRNGFHFDDFHSVVHNHHLDRLSNIPSFFVDPSTFSVNPRSAMYRPLLQTSFALDRALFDGSAAGHHAVNVLLHGLSAVVVLLSLRALRLTMPVAAVGALLFAVHPIQSEAVCYISSRSEILAGLFMLLAVLAVLRGSSSVGVGGLVGAGLLSKSVAAMAPVLLLVAQSARWGGEGLRRGWRAAAVALGLAVVYTVVVKGAVGRALLDAPVRDIGAQLWTQSKAHLYYVTLVAMPVHLNVEHQFQVARRIDLEAAMSAAAIGSLALVAWKARRSLPILGQGAAWWFAALLPATIVPLIVLVNEHRLYVASVALFLPIALCWASLHRRQPRWMANGLLAVYTLMLVVGTLGRVETWRSEQTLWADAAAKAPLMLRPHLRLADALDKSGQIEAAEQSYLRAIELRPAHPASRNNLGLLYRRTNRFDEASAQFASLLRASPDNEPARLNLAELELMRGNWQRADAQYDTVLRFSDTGGRAQLRRAQIALRFAGDAESALRHFEAAQRVGAEDVDLQVGRGVALRRLGRTGEALDAYERALEHDPERADVWFNLGNLQVEAGDDEAAAEAFRRVIELQDSELMSRAREQLRSLESKQR